MFEFLEATQLHIVTTCCKCGDWIDTTSTCDTVRAGDPKAQHQHSAGELVEDVDTVSLLQRLVLSIQRVMVRHRKCAADTQENSSERSIFVSLPHWYFLLQVNCWNSLAACTYTQPLLRTSMT